MDDDSSIHSGNGLGGPRYYGIPRGRQDIVRRPRGEDVRCNRVRCTSTFVGRALHAFLRCKDYRPYSRTLRVG